MSGASFTDCGLSSSLPASILERSSTSLMSPSRWVPARCTRPQRLLRLFRAEPHGIGDHHFGEPDDGIERGAQLVAHVGDELGLALAGLGETCIGRLELTVHALHHDCLTLLPYGEEQPGNDVEGEIDQQIFEREQICRDRLADGHLLDAADVADLPVALRAFRMGVVAVDASRPHDHRRHQADAVGEDRPGDVDDLLAGIGAQDSKGVRSKSSSSCAARFLNG